MLTHAYILGINPEGPWMELNASALWDLNGAQGWWQGAHYRLPAAEPGAKGEATGSIQGQTVQPRGQLKGTPAQVQGLDENQGLRMRQDKEPLGRLFSARFCCTSGCLQTCRHFDSLQQSDA